MATQEEWIKKHPPLSDEDIKKKLKEAFLAKDKYSTDMTDVENNLLGYTSKLIPIVDTETDKVLMWMKQLTGELMEMFITEFSPDIQGSKKERMEKQYKLIADLIAVPKHDAEWWKKNITPSILKLISNALEAVFEELGATMENF